MRIPYGGSVAADYEPRQIAWMVGATLACAVVGALMAVGEMIGATFAAVLVGLATAAVLRPRVASLLGLSAFLLIAGYVALNRSFAGLRLPLGGLPLYVGEIALGLLLPPALDRLRNRRLSFPLVAVSIWMAFSLLVTLPNLPTYGLDSVRDAAIWYYGLYAFVGAAAWYGLGLSGVQRGFRYVFLGALLATPIAMAAQAGQVPTFELPILDVPFFTDQRWDAAGMHLLGAAVFFLTARPASGSNPPLAMRVVTPLLVGAALALVVSTQVRATLVGFLGVLLLMLFLRLWKPVLALLATVVLVLAPLWILDVKFEETPRHEVSARAVLDRQLSTLIYLIDDQAAAENRVEDAGTIEWRTIWWDALIQDTLGDPTLLLVGRGYGPDLREVVIARGQGSLNWEQGTEDGRPVRSPHNIAVTILARSGVLGLLAWLLMLGASFVYIIRATRRAGDRRQQLFGVWATAYLAAMLLVACFGVVLESPFGAIPFFFVLGLAVAWAGEQLALARSRMDQPASSVTGRAQPPAMAMHGVSRWPIVRPS